MADERAIIQQVQNGDHEAFSILVETYEKQVYTLCYRMTGSREDAADLSQEAFLKAWRGLRFYQFEASFSTWLYRLTSNVCIDFLRQQKRRPTVSLTVEDEEGETEECSVPDSAPLPEEQLLAAEQAKAIKTAMAQLEEEFRLILTLRVVQDLPYEQIAETLDLKVGTVKSRLARARNKLKKILLQNGNNLVGDSSYLTGKGGMRHDM